VSSHFLILQHVSVACAFFVNRLNQYMTLHNSVPHSSDDKREKQREREEERETKPPVELDAVYFRLSPSKHTTLSCYNL